MRSRGLPSSPGVTVYSSLTEQPKLLPRRKNLTWLKPCLPQCQSHRNWQDELPHPAMLTEKKREWEFRWLEWTKDRKLYIIKITIYHQIGTVQCCKWSLTAKDPHCWLQSNDPRGMEWKNSWVSKFSSSGLLCFTPKYLHENFLYENPAVYHY